MNLDFKEKLVILKINKLEDIIHFDVGNRGLGDIWTKDELIKAARELNSSGTVLILTGFYLPSAAATETDGAPGAVSIANSLISLGKKVTLMTDSFSYDVIQGVINNNMYNIPIICYQEGMNLSNVINSLRIEKTEKLAVVSVERPGRSKDGKSYSMRGYDVSAFNKKLDALFIEVKKIKASQIVTVAIGDGGNEIGMGNIYDSIVKSIPNGEKIASIVETDYLITAGVSNWGGIAIGYALKLLNPEMSVEIMTPDLHEKIVRIMIKYGAVDGVTLKKECSVDGFNMNIHNQIITKMKEVICE
jgi:hypothetical protein